MVAFVFSLAVGSLTPLVSNSGTEAVVENRGSPGEAAGAGLPPIMLWPAFSSLTPFPVLTVQVAC